MIGSEAVRQPEVRIAYENVMSRQAELLTDHLLEYSHGKISDIEVKSLVGIILAAIEGAYQLAVTSKSIMPKNYAAGIVMDLIESYIQQHAKMLHE